MSPLQAILVRLAINSQDLAQKSLRLRASNMGSGGVSRWSGGEVQTLAHTLLPVAARRLFIFKSSESFCESLAARLSRLQVEQGRDDRAEREDEHVDRERDDFMEHTEEIRAAALQMQRFDKREDEKSHQGCCQNRHHELDEENQDDRAL